MDEQTLTGWALAFREGDEDGFTKLVESLTRTLIALAYRYTGDWEGARDLTQETWVRVHRHIARYDPTRPFTAWVHALHRNACLDHLRRPWVRRERAADPAGLEPLPAPEVSDPAAHAEWREFRARVLDAAAELSESQRRVFLAVDLEERPRDEVARELGITPGNLRTTLHFARRRVADALRDLREDV